jgi:hypothetical protein
MQKALAEKRKRAVLLTFPEGFSAFTKELVPCTKSFVQSCLLFLKVFERLP